MGARTSGAPHDFSSVKPGGHVCLPYAHEDEKQTAIADFIRDGLVRGERCIYWGHARDFTAIMARLESHGPPVPKLREKQQVLHADLEVPPEQLRDIDAQTAGIRAAIAQAHADGFTGLRVIGDPPPTLRAVLDREQLASLEIKLTELYAADHATGLCTFDQRATDAAAFEIALATHDSAIVSGRLCPNPYFTHPSSPGAPQAGPERSASLTANILNAAEAHDFLEAQSAALIVESSRIGRRDAAYRAHIAALTRAIEARDRLILTTARWLARPLPAMCSHLADMARDARYGSVHEVLDTCGDHLAAVTRLSRGLDEIASFLQMQVVLRPEELDIVELTRTAVGSLEDDKALAPVEIVLEGAPSIMGTWDRLRLTHLFHGLIRTARDQGYDTRVRLRLDDLIEFVRVRMEFTLPYAPAISDSGERVRMLPYGTSDESDYERLAVQLWPAREAVRMMGGTLGISTWADARVIFTLDLPKVLPANPAELDRMG